MSVSNPDPVNEPGHLINIPWLFGLGIAMVVISYLVMTFTPDTYGPHFIEAAVGVVGGFLTVFAIPGLGYHATH
jgi:hypothetical protein